MMFDEPQLYKLVMDDKASATSFEDYIDTRVGFKQESIAAIHQSFGLQGKDAEMLYYQQMIVGIGLAHTFVEGGAPLSIPQVSEIFG